VFSMMRMAAKDHISIFFSAYLAVPSETILIARA
jgi:hypothetical protein